jgi:hypothetical protein
MLAIRVTDQIEKIIDLIMKYFFYLGKFDAKDLVYYFQKLGIKLELEEASQLVGK